VALSDHNTPERANCLPHSPEVRHRMTARSLGRRVSVIPPPIFRTGRVLQAEPIVS